MDRGEQRDIGGVGEEVAAAITVHLEPGGVDGDAFGVHVVGDGEEGGFGVAVCAVDEHLSAPRRGEGCHLDVAVWILWWWTADYGRGGIRVGEIVDPTARPKQAIDLRGRVR